MSNSLVEKKVALGITGGIAAYKAAEILRGLQRAGCTVRVAMTKRACEFIQPLTFRALSGSHVVVDDYATDNPDPIAHITFSQTVDLFLVAPATANIIAKFANGIADDFITATYLASTAPVMIAPAMNTSMWHHPATQRNLDKLRSDGVLIIDPDEGEMACKTVGPGRLSEPEVIVDAALEILRNLHTKTAQDLANEHILLTVGATREAIDPVRFITNNSSGRMGFAIAEAAVTRGARVTVIAGSTSVEPPKGVTLIRADSANDMHAAVLKAIAQASVFIASAAVADYRPLNRSTQKIKKNDASWTIEFERTQDILGAVANKRHDGLLVIGFAAETENLLANARQKLERKNLDAIVANDVTSEGAGFDSNSNEVTILSGDGSAPIHVPLMPKSGVANIILDEVVRLRGRSHSNRKRGWIVQEQSANRVSFGRMWPAIMTLEPTAEYLAILRDAREQIVYLNELGVQSVDTGGDNPVPGKIGKSTSAGTRAAPSLEAMPHPEVTTNRVHPPTTSAPSLLFEDSLLPPPTLHKTSETFEQIHADIGDCTRCPLYEKRTHIVHTEGNRKARLMFVGEAPGADEDIQARPFVGRAGQLLTKIIEAIGFKRDEVLIGNVNRCRPPGNRPPTEQEASTCKPFLLREIASVQPDVIVVLGNTATRNLLETKIGITRLRGEFQDYQGVKVMPTFHPAYLLRDPSKKQETWQDLKKVRDYLEVTRKRAT